MNEVALEIVNSVLQGVPVAAILYLAWRGEQKERKEQDKVILEHVRLYAELVTRLETAEKAGRKSIERNTEAMENLKRGLDVWIGEKIG